MNDCATQKIRFETQSSLALEAAFDGGRITSDGGLTWLARIDSQMGLSEAISPGVCRSGEREGGAIRSLPSSSSASSR